MTRQSLTARYRTLLGTPKALRFQATAVRAAGDFRQGESLGYKAVASQQRPQVSAAERYLGPWSNAVEAALIAAEETAEQVPVAKIKSKQA